MHPVILIIDYEVQVQLVTVLADTKSQDFLLIIKFDI